MAEETNGLGNETMELEGLWDVKQVAEFLRMKVGSVYHLVSEKRVPCVRLSARCLRFQPEAIMEWVQHKSQKGDGNEGKNQE